MLKPHTVLGNRMQRRRIGRGKPLLGNYQS